MTNSVTSAGWRLAGMDLTTIGLIASAMSWAAFIIRPFSAPITDRGNKKADLHRCSGGRPWLCSCIR